MSNPKHGNWDFDVPSRIPNNAMDTYWSQDKIRDMRYLEQIGSRVDYDLPLISRGLEFRIEDKLNEGIFIRINAGVGYYEQTYKIPQDWTETPPELTDITITRQIKLREAYIWVLAPEEVQLLQSYYGQRIYVNAYETEQNGNERQKTKAAVVYPYEVELQQEFKLELQEGGLSIGSFIQKSTSQPYQFSIYQTQNRRVLVRNNLVYNYDFRFFSNQNGAITNWYDFKHPDGWIYTDNGTDGKIGYDEENRCCKIVTSSDGSGARVFKQSLHEFVNWKDALRGSTVTVKLYIRGGGVINLSDGVSIMSYSLLNTGDLEEVVLQINIDLAATKLEVSIEIAASNAEIEVYKVFGNKGLEAIESLPCIVQGVIGEIKTYDATETPPSGEFELNGVELPENYSRLDSFINGKFGRGGNGRSKLNDSRGLFERQWAHGSDNDPDRDLRSDRGDGVAGDHVGTLQGDAIRNITGSVGRWSSRNMIIEATGCFQAINHGNLVNTFYSSGGGDQITADFDASRVVPTASQNRPASTNRLKTTRWC